MSDFSLELWITGVVGLLAGLCWMFLRRSGRREADSAKNRRRRKLARAEAEARRALELRLAEVELERERRATGDHARRWS